MSRSIAAQRVARLSLELDALQTELEMAEDDIREFGWTTHRQVARDAAMEAVVAATRAWADARAQADTADKLAVLRRLAKKHGGKVTRARTPYWVEFPSRQKAEAFDMDASVHGFFTEATMRPLATGGTWCVPVRSRA